jgi:hypothetical protein
MRGTRALHWEAGIGQYDGPNAFITNYVGLGADCIDFTNSDIGGIGVVLSAVVQAILSMTALILISCFYGLTKKWHIALQCYVLASADTAVISGAALLLSAYANLPLTSGSQRSPLDFQDAYFTLCTYLCSAFCSCHLASLLVLRDRVKRHPLSTRIRVGLLTVFAVLLTVTIDLSRYAFEPVFVEMERVLVFRMGLPVAFEYDFLEYFLPPLFMAYAFWISVYNLLWRPDEKVERPLWRKVLRFIVFSSPATVFALQLIFTLGSVTFVLLQKFTKAPPPTADERKHGIGQWCSINNEADNMWGFGQLCAMILLLVPFYAATQASCG